MVGGWRLQAGAGVWGGRHPTPPPHQVGPAHVVTTLQDTRTFTYILPHALPTRRDATTYITQRHYGGGGSTPSRATCCLCHTAFGSFLPSPSRLRTFKLDLAYPALFAVVPFPLLFLVVPFPTPHLCCCSAAISGWRTVVRIHFILRSSPPPPHSPPHYGPTPCPLHTPHHHHTTPPHTLQRTRTHTHTPLHRTLHHTPHTHAPATLPGPPFHLPNPFVLCLPTCTCLPLTPLLLLVWTDVVWWAFSSALLLLLLPDTPLL